MIHLPQLNLSPHKSDLFIGINVEGPEDCLTLTILPINQLTAIFLGLFDISNFRYTRSNFHPHVLSVLRDYSKIAHRHNKLIGSIATTPSQLSNLIESDFDYILYGVDMNIVSNAYKEISLVTSTN